MPQAKHTDHPTQLCIFRAHPGAISRDSRSASSLMTKALGPHPCAPKLQFNSHLHCKRLHPAAALAQSTRHTKLPSKPVFKTLCMVREDEKPLCSSPFEILGLSEDCTEDDVKSAFRNKIKEFHPDVYKGTENAVAITQRLIEAYEQLLSHIGQGIPARRSFDPFENPECEAQQVFVYELNCMGKGCPYSCIERAPAVFKFAPDTGRARAVAQGAPDDYAVQLAVGQCPRNCIYYVTNLQRETLEQVLQRALEGTIYSEEVNLLESLLARAKYENGRYTPKPKRAAKKSTKWVDWY